MLKSGLPAVRALLAPLVSFLRAPFGSVPLQARESRLRSWQMPGHSHGGLSRQAALDQPVRGSRLHHHALARSTGIFGPANDQHPELRRHEIEPLAGVLSAHIVSRTSADNPSA